MKKHTPGPWEADSIVCWSKTTGDWVFGDDILAKTEDSFLISSAPELLEALELCVKDGDIMLSRKVLNKARAAIAKAKGLELL